MQPAPLPLRTGSQLQQLVEHKAIALAELSQQGTAIQWMLLARQALGVDQAGMSAQRLRIAGQPALQKRTTGFAMADVEIQLHCTAFIARLSLQGDLFISEGDADLLWHLAEMMAKASIGGLAHSMPGSP